MFAVAGSDNVPLDYLQFAFNAQAIVMLDSNFELSSVTKNAVVLENNRFVSCISFRSMK